MAAHYMHNLTAILADDANASLNSPAQLTYAITNRPLDTSTNSSMQVPLVHDLLLQKSNGKFFLIVWGERYKGTASDEINVVFNATFDEVKVYNPAQYNSSAAETGTSPIQTYTGVSSIPLTLKNHPYILELSSGVIGNIPDAADSGVSIHSEKGKLILLSKADRPVSFSIHNVTGQTLVAGSFNGRYEVSLPAGIYIVKTNSISKKQIVR
jgi:hypothetical protein